MDANFPEGLRVLLVDDNPVPLKLIETLLKICSYHVTTCSRAMQALETIRANKGGFDIVICEVHMPEIDGFELLELIGSETDIPVILMSDDDSRDAVMKGVTSGACDYLTKPLHMSVLKNIWQHVVRKNMKRSQNVEHNDEENKPSEDSENASTASQGKSNDSKRKREGEKENEVNKSPDSSTLKKQRVVWDTDLHQKFVDAVNKLGIDNAVPKKILELMNVPGLTRENIASHLQKYRLWLKKMNEPQHQEEAHTSFNPISSFDGFHLQPLAASTQHLSQAPMPIINQNGVFFNSNRQIANSPNMRPAKMQNGAFFDSKTQIVISPNMRPSMMQNVSYGNMQNRSWSINPFAMDSVGTQQPNPRVQQTSLALQQLDHAQIAAQGQPQRSVYGNSGEIHSTLASNIGQQTVSNGISNQVLVSNQMNEGSSSQGNFTNMSLHHRNPQGLHFNAQNRSAGEPSHETQENGKAAAYELAVDDQFINDIEHFLETGEGIAQPQSLTGFDFQR